MLNGQRDKGLGGQGATAAVAINFVVSPCPFVPKSLNPLIPLSLCPFLTRELLNRTGLGLARVGGALGKIRAQRKILMG